KALKQFQIYFIRRFAIIFLLGFDPQSLYQIIIKEYLRKYKIELRGLYNVIPHIQCIVYFICRQEGLIKNVRKGEPELYNSIRHLENFYKDKVKSSWISKDYYNKVDTIINVLPAPMNPKDFKT